MQMRRDRLVAQRQHGLDQAGDTGRGFQMAEIGFGRAHRQRLIGRTGFAQHGPQSADFDRVAQGRAGAVPFNVADRGWVNSGVAQRRADDGLLRRGVRHSEAAALAIVVDRGATHDGPDPVAVAVSVAEAL